MSYLDGSLTKGGSENSRFLFLLDVFVTSNVLLSDYLMEGLVGMVDRIGFNCLNYLMEGLRLFVRTLLAFFSLAIFDNCLSLYLFTWKLPEWCIAKLSSKLSKRTLEFSFNPERALLMFGRSWESIKSAKCGLKICFGGFTATGEFVKMMCLCSRMSNLLCKLAFESSDSIN